MGRGLLYLIILLIVTAVIWASITRVNVIVSADGKLVPRAESVRLSIPQGGIISKVIVDVGAPVRAGQPILEMDSFRERADTARVTHEIAEAKAEAVRYRESAAAIDSATEHLKAELKSAQQIKDLMAEEAGAMQEGYQDGAVSLFELQAKQRELEEAQGKIAQLKADLSRSTNESAENRRHVGEIAEKIEALQSDLSRNIEAKQKTIVTAPIAGTVTYLNALRPGSYMAPNEVAATIYPGDEPLMAEVWIPNESIRRIKPSLPVRMKLKAYPFHQYGLLPGTVVSVEPDVNEAGAYRAWIKPDRLTLSGNDGPEKMRTGLALTAEIVVDRRTIMSVILDPLRRLRRGASSISQ